MNRDLYNLWDLGKLIFKFIYFPAYTVCNKDWRDGSEDLNSIFSTNMAALNHELTPVPGDPMPPSGFGHQTCT